MQDVLTHLDRDAVGIMAKRPQAFVVARHPEFKLSHAYAAIAAQLGLPNWNTLEATLRPGGSGTKAPGARPSSKPDVAALAAAHCAGNPDAARWRCEAGPMAVVGFSPDIGLSLVLGDEPVGLRLALRGVVRAAVAAARPLLVVSALDPGLLQGDRRAPKLVDEAWIRRVAREAIAVHGLEPGRVASPVRGAVVLDLSPMHDPFTPLLAAMRGGAMLALLPKGAVVVVEGLFGDLARACYPGLVALADELASCQCSLVVALPSLGVIPEDAAVSDGTKVLVAPRLPLEAGGHPHPMPARDDAAAALLPAAVRGMTSAASFAAAASEPVWTSFVVPIGAPFVARRAPPKPLLPFSYRCDPWQVEADLVSSALPAVQAGITVLAGSVGCGKTTAAKSMIGHAVASGRRVVVVGEQRYVDEYDALLGARPGATLSRISEDGSGGDVVLRYGGGALRRGALPVAGDVHAVVLHEGVLASAAILAIVERAASAWPGALVVVDPADALVRTPALWSNAVWRSRDAARAGTAVVLLSQSFPRDAFAMEGIAYVAMLTGSVDPGFQLLPFTTDAERGAREPRWIRATARSWSEGASVEVGGLPSVRA